MKIFRKILLSTHCTLLAFILGILGVQTSCNPNAEYGSPVADFKIHGCVTSDSTGEAIKDMEVVCYYTHYSDSLANYQITREASPENQTFIVHFHDTDSTLYGSYQDFDTAVTFQDPQFTGGNGDWYVGETSKEINVQLKNK